MNFMNAERRITEAPYMWQYERKENVVIRQAQGRVPC